MPYEYDVFLSHNSKDKAAVEIIAKTLQQKFNLKCWLDKWNLVPGEPWQEALEEALNQCESVAIFVGPDTISPWENEEMRSALEERVHNKARRVIPVLLPGSVNSRKPRLPRFLKRLTWVDLRAGLDNEEALYVLGCGIKGIAPGQLANSATLSSLLPSENLETVQLILEGEFSEFNELKREDLVGVLAALLHVDKSSVKILRTYQGSIILEIELAEAGAIRLLKYFEDGDFRLKKLGLISVKLLKRPEEAKRKAQSASEPEVTGQLTSPELPGGNAAAVVNRGGMNAEQAWQAVLGQLQMEMPRASFDTWVRDTKPLSYQDGTLTIGVRNTYARDWLESRLASTVSRLLVGIMNTPVAVNFRVHGETVGNLNDKEYFPRPGKNAIYDQSAPLSNLNPRYLFETFVVGSGNRLAHAACLAVAEKPSRAYNPLFLFGNVGLGKTHLLHAIGNACHMRGLNVLYVTAEEFTNDMIIAIRTHTNQAFREKYRSADVLLVDDIQFIGGKVSTQEEFFHTFNTLHGQDKQIVVVSDRSPKSLNTLDERLRSRFEWGLTADIQPPDLETRLAILRSKAERTGRQVPDEILESIARRVQSNIRELEGALNRILAFADLSGAHLSSQLVEVALADLLPRRSDVQPEKIIELVAKEWQTSVEALLGRDRSQKIAQPRQVAMYLLRKETDASLPQIGEVLGGRDHTAVMYAIEKIASEIETKTDLRKRVHKVLEILHAPAA